MAELIRQLLDLLRDIWPFRVVSQWQNGLYHVNGRYWWTVGPGLWLVVPYLCEVHKVPVVPALFTTPLQTITLKDGRTLTYSASITARVEDANLAFNTIDRWQETVVELAARKVSEEFADAEPGRFDAARGRRDKLLEAVRVALDADTKRFGVRIDDLGLNNFVLGVRTVRLLLDQAVLTQGNHLQV